MISSLINSSYNYLLGSDVRKLRQWLPDLLIDGAFLLALGAGLFGLVIVFLRSAQIKSPSPGQQPLTNII